MFTSFSYMKYRLQHHDHALKQRLILLTSFVLAMILIPVCLIVKPLTQLKSALKEKSEEYMALQDTEKKEKEQKVATKAYVVPINGILTCGYGMRNDPFTNQYSKHTGIDISGTHWDNVRAIADGTVTFAGSANGFGNCVEIRHEEENRTIYSFYAHLSRIIVTEGQTITKGDSVGLEGGEPGIDPNPGNSTGHHLHFEIRTQSGYGNDIDPTPFWK